MQRFDVLGCSLDGTKLVEASAGTGKTFALVLLYLRLVLEKGLRPPQILVVTYTEAATKELRDRIRHRLRQAVQAFREPEGEAADGLVQALVMQTVNGPEALQRLTQALGDFDQAAIFTIHGFCQRTLQENAFESGHLFDTELVIEQDDLKLQIVEDFWRQHFYQAPPFLVQHALISGYSPAALMRMVKTSAIQPDLKVVPEVQPVSWEELHQRYAGLIADIRSLREQWPKVHKSLAELLHSEALSGTSYGALRPGGKGDGSTARDAKVESLLGGMTRYFELFDPDHPLPLPEKFELLTSTKLREATRVKQVTPIHPVFDLCDVIAKAKEQWVAALDSQLLFLKTELFRTLREELPLRKHRQNIQHFDDLLLKLRDALQQAGGAALATAVRSRYQAALIDEFQDTDPVQYDIFRKLFADSDRCLFLIGDPKQAIYSFRGADVFAFMDAAREISERFTLGTNYRSEPSLIQAVNTVFGNRPGPFVYPEIGFQQAVPPAELEPSPLTMDEEPLPPLRIWFVSSDAAHDENAAAKGGKTAARIAKSAAKPLILQAVAAEIAHLLSLGAAGRARIGARQLHEKDIAVLLRANREARELKETLADLGIPAVLQSSDNVFDSREALEMERLLRAIATPHNERRLRAALVTDMLGAKSDDLMAMTGDTERWERWLLNVRNYAQLWSVHGFIRMFRQVVLDHGIRAHLVAFPDGERRLTNILHLAEILHQQTVDHQLGMVDLLHWLTEQRNPDTRTASEEQLRLESDDQAVQLVTIHRSKGLQYPVVFCPFVWESSKDNRKDRTLLFHDETDDRRLTLDLGTAAPERQSHEAMAAREALAENLRLLYVALTRAEKHCTLTWGCFNQADTAAPAYLLHYQGSSGNPRLVDDMETSVKALDDAAVMEQLRTLEARAGGCIDLRLLPSEPASRYTPQKPEPELLHARTFGGVIDHQWRVSSFSALTSRKPQEGEWPDRDEGVLPDRSAEEDGEPGDTAAPVVNMFRFPQGARPGTLIHDILEHLDFADGDLAARAKLVAQKLNEYGFEPLWCETVCEMLARLLRVPLGGPEKPFSLGDIPMADRLNELEFFLPLARISPERLRDAFVGFPGLLPKSWASWLERLRVLDFTPVHGFLRGFIDLVFSCNNRFYLVDWKSNHLGNTFEDYGPSALTDVMIREYYLLQYHLYVIALDRYLAIRIPGYRYQDHFGGVYYIFLRGVDPEVGPHFGVFHDRPPGVLVESLTSALLGNDVREPVFA
jgi:exodeoxyribonuclease V beta subunit